MMRSGDSSRVLLAILAVVFVYGYTYIAMNIGGPQKPVSDVQSLQGSNDNQLALVASTVGPTSADQLDQIIKQLDQLGSDAVNLGSTAGATGGTGGTSGQCIILTRTLTQNSSDTASRKDVTALQQFLYSRGFLSSPSTGYFGALTVAAVRKFQIQYQLIPSAYSDTIQVGPATRAKIKALTCGTQTLTIQDQNDLGHPDVQAQSVPASGSIPGVKAQVKLVLPNQSDVLNLGRTDFSKAVPTTIKVSVSGDGATYAGINGLGKTFTYYGGSFPGNGGTCTAHLVDGCTIVVSFLPQISLGEMAHGGADLKYVTDMSLAYSTADGASAQTNPVRLGGYSDKGGTVTFNDNYDSHDLGYLIHANADMTFGLHLTGAVSSVQVLPVSSLFSLKNIDCQDSTIAQATGISDKFCNITYTIHATSVGDYTLPVGISYFDGQVSTQAVKNVTIHVFGPDMSVTPDKNMLIVYNSRSADGKKIADYYTANRPGIQNANVLSVSYPDHDCSICGAPDDEIARFPVYKSSIEAPISAWLSAHPDKDIRVIVMIRGLPTRVYMDEPPRVATAETDPTTESTGYLLANIPLDMTTTGFFNHSRYPQARAMVTYMDMGSTEATLAYIDKLKNVYNAMSTPSLFISGSNAGKAGSLYYFEDENMYGPVTGSSAIGKNDKDAVVSFDPTAITMYRPYGSTLPSTLSNVAGFFSWGGNSKRTGAFATNGSLTFTGNSGWFLIDTAESFNGKRQTWQSNFINWFSANAFGGINYSNTPAAAVVHVDEPNALGINGPTYFPCWNNGFTFIDCAWFSRRSPMMMAVGDPWVVK